MVYFKIIFGFNEAFPEMDILETPSSKNCKIEWHHGIKWSKEIEQLHFQSGRMQ